jgi:hypothetical protein
MIMKNFELLEYMTNGVVTIVFEKTDGSERTLKGTLSPTLIPEDQRPQGSGRVLLNDDIQHVFDVEANGWRSFAWSRLRSFT